MCARKRFTVKLYVELIKNDLAVINVHGVNIIKIHTDLLIVNAVSNYFLSFYSHHSRFFESAFEHCLTQPTQSRFSIAFPLICTHFINCTHDVCPEEVSDGILCTVRLMLCMTTCRVTVMLCMWNLPSWSSFG